MNTTHPPVPSAPANPHPNGLPAGVTVFERGWLSSNNVLLIDDHRAALVDTGYCTHAEQTLALVAHALADRPLSHVLNTHLHSDHCGGNAALAQRYPGLVTAIPPGSAQAVRNWNEENLGYNALGQAIVRYEFNYTLLPGSTERLAGQEWEIHAAPGHDPHAVLLFEPNSRTLISGDALWENGFGVVFPELAGESGYSEVASTLDLIERLRPQAVIPGHGPVFTAVERALAQARQRLEGFVTQPHRHTRHAAKVLLKYKLLELVHAPRTHLLGWAQTTPMMSTLHQQHTGATGQTLFEEWLGELLADLIRSGAARAEGGIIYNA